jgi:hypothetical protein
MCAHSVAIGDRPIVDAGRVERILVSGAAARLAAQAAFAMLAVVRWRLRRRLP